MCEWRTIARSPAVASDSGMAERDEVEGAGEIGVELSLQREVGGGDRRDEAGVEGLGEPKRRVEAVPPGPQGEFVQAQLAGVEESVQLDRGEVGLEQGAVLLDRVLAQVPGIVRSLG